MTKDKAIAELVRIWHSPHLDLSLKAGLAEAIDTLKESNLNDSLVRDEADDSKESESKLDLISRQNVVNEIHKYFVEEIDKTPTEIDEDGDELYADMPTVNSLLACNKELSKRIKLLPSAEPQPKPISYIECANAMLKMWIDNVLTDGEYYRIMEKLNSKHMADMRGGDDSEID